MKIALIYPPACDPTAPYLAVPILTGFLRANGVDTLPVDANIEAWEWLLSRERLTFLARRLEKRLAKLERLPALNHVQQRAYSTLWGARGDARSAPEEIEDALAIMRDSSGLRFYNPEEYGRAVAIIASALSLVSAAYAPLTLDFQSYRTPFSLSSAAEILHDSQPDRNPFHDYFAGPLHQKLQEAQPGLIGISVAFPGQIQPAFSLAHLLRKSMPEVHLTVGGPAMTQFLLRLTGTTLQKALGPFHSAILFEGEEALLHLVREVEQGGKPSGVIAGARNMDLSALPPPDFTGLPLHHYLAPAPVLPYDPSRGCYWGKCAFCHYGLCEKGTAAYRERPAAQVAAHLHTLAASHGCRLFYFSQDAMAPRFATQVAAALKTKNTGLRWATDMRGETSLTQECCRDLAAGGALACALGIESGSGRILQRIDKGLRPDELQRAAAHLAAAGIAVEAMCFTDFPGETGTEAMSTIRFLKKNRPHLALFICGRFGLVHGSRVAGNPKEFGIKEIWQVQGDEFGAALFYEEEHEAKTEAERERLEGALEDLSQRWWLHCYPWAGSLSTAHSLLWYEHHGPDIFRRLAGTKTPWPAPEKTWQARANFPLHQIEEESAAGEEEIWDTLINEQRRLSRQAYNQLAALLPAAAKAPGLWRFSPGGKKQRLK